jgi:hypothetical protein
MSVHQFPRRHNPLGVVTWHTQLESATDEHDVIVIARNFIAQFSPQEMNLLPTPCRPGKFFEAADVAGYAFALARHDCADDGETAALVDKLAGFFSQASNRLSQILASANALEDGSRQSA